MPTLYHSPNSRSSRIIAQLMLMGKLDAVEVVTVDIPRQDGAGQRDPRNPHPEGKVPFLVTDEGHELRESAAIMMYLEEIFDHPLSPAIGSPDRADYLGWMFYYSGVVEPVLVAELSGIDHPAIERNFRDMAAVGATLARALEEKPFLMGETVSVADILMASAFSWMPHVTPDIAVVKAWSERVGRSLDGVALADFEAAAMEKISASADV